MQRLTLLALGGIGIVAIFLLFQMLFSVPPTSEDSAVQEVSVSSSGGSISSTLNLIVRVSPRLTANKPQHSSSSTMQILSVPENNTRYKPYSSDASFRGQSTLLFFAQPDDPFSIEHDSVLSTLAAQNLLRISTFKVDFASASMKLQYGVIVPDTFILLDATGQRIQSIIHPSTAELRALLTSNPQ